MIHQRKRRYIVLTRTLIISSVIGMSAQGIAQTDGYDSTLPDIEINLHALDQIKHHDDVLIQQATPPAPPPRSLPFVNPTTTAKTSGKFVSAPAPIAAVPTAPAIAPVNQAAPVVAVPPASAGVSVNNAAPIVSANHPTPITQNQPQAVVPVAVAGPAGAPAPAAPFKPSGFVEAGGNASSLTSNYNRWSGEYLKGEVQTDPDNRWSAQFLDEREFGDEGQYAVIGNTHQFNEDWYSTLSIGGADQGFFLPRYRVDAFINRKLLADQSLIATVGLGTDKAMTDSHTDDSVFLGATYYFPKLWIVQGGIRFNDSNPGGVESTSEFIAVTEGEDKKHFITLRYGFGREAYQVIGPSTVESDFASQEVSLDLREWVWENWGFDARTEYYHNPYYDRVGMNLGVFYEF